MFGGTPGIIAYMRGKGLLAASKDCGRYSRHNNNNNNNEKLMYKLLRCNIPMEEKLRRDVSDGVCWWCKTTKSIRDGSFLASPG